MAGVAQLALWFIEACGASDLTTTVEQHADNILRELLGSSSRGTAKETKSPPQQPEAQAQQPQPQQQQPQPQQQPLQTATAAVAAAAAAAPRVVVAPATAAPSGASVQSQEQPPLHVVPPQLAASPVLPILPLETKSASVLQLPQQQQPQQSPEPVVDQLVRHVEPPPPQPPQVPIPDLQPRLAPNQVIVSIATHNLSLCKVSEVCFQMPRHLLDIARIAVHEVQFSAEFQIEIECKSPVSREAKQALHKWALSRAVPNVLFIRVLCA